jgi:hypothetical protein
MQKVAKGAGKEVVLSREFRITPLGLRNNRFEEGLSPIEETMKVPSLTILGSRARMTQGVRDDGCGCAMGAKFLGMALVASIGWYAWHRHSFTLSLWSVCWRVMLISFAAAAVGKIVGIAVFRTMTSTNSR